MATLTDLASVSSQLKSRNALASKVVARLESGQPSVFQRQLDGVEKHLSDLKEVEVLPEKELIALKNRVIEFEVMVDECLLEEGLEGLLGCRTIGRSIAKLSKVPELESAVVKLEDALIAHAVKGAKQCLCETKLKRTKAA